ncbi:MAG TPA: pilus assembly protein N-terminal domain-containing protein [Candidatus Rubrimentiphilum sp.]|nr:pilus assembly protein N-terminal domain-containing protein [Candidatus Rubrimentiphilum sp.]
MRSMLIGTAAALTLAALGSCPALAQSDTVQLLSVQSGHSVLLQTPGLTRVAVGDGRIAGVVPIGSSQLVINGKAPGHTTIFIWEAGGRASYEVTVTEQQVDQIAQMLRTSIDEPGVQVVSFNSSVVVRGVVPDGAHFQMLTDILSRFEKYAAAEKYTIVNAVTVAHPLGDLQRDLMNIPGATGIRVDPDGHGNVIVSGHVHDAQTVAAILERARGLAGPYLASDGKLVDRISTDTNTQIDIKVYVLEVDRTAASNLGVQLQAANINGGTYTLGPPTFPIVENIPSSPLKVGAFFRTITLAPTLNLMLSEGHARLLSSPDLVTMPGMAATFLVGGQIPIPFSTGLGQTSIQYKDFGVQLNVTPTLLGNGSVQAAIAPDISDLDFADGVSQNGFVIPALKESKLSTNVITQPGESIIMGGMVRRVEQRTIQKIPILGDLPILGQLFRSTNYQNNQSDIVFVMTPQVITR